MNIMSSNIMCNEKYENDEWFKDMLSIWVNDSQRFLNKYISDDNILRFVEKFEESNERFFRGILLSDYYIDLLKDNCDENLLNELCETSNIIESTTTDINVAIEFACIPDDSNDFCGVVVEVIGESIYKLLDSKYEKEVIVYNPSYTKIISRHGLN